MGKDAITDLLSKLKEAEIELQEEEALTQMSQAEAAEHEKLAKKLEKQARNDEPFAFMKSSTSQAWFRAQTPAQQREIKDELLRCLQELEGIQQEKIENQLIASNTEQKLSVLRMRGGEAGQEVA